MDTTSRPARYVTLRDYLRVLRRYRVAIVVLAVIGAVAGYVAAKRQTPVYQATATASFEDPTQQLAYIGLSNAGAQTPGAVAAQTAETLTRPQVLTQVRHSLRASLPVARLSGALSGQVTSAGLLNIQASWSNPQFAAQLANATASVLVRHANRSAQAQFSAVAQATRSQIARLTSGSTNSRVSSGQLPFAEDELARLDTLTKLSRTASVQLPAQPPGAPVSPKTTRSAVIGFLLGLLLAIGIAFFRDSMDRRLRGGHDVESSFDLPVIGRVRREVMGQIAQSANGGSDHAVDVEAFRILRRNLEFLGREGQVRSVLVTSAAPDEGKTTVAASLAFAMAYAGRRTLLVDCDLRRPTLATRLEIEAAPGLSDFLGGRAGSQQILRTLPAAGSQSPNGGGNGGGAALSNLVFIPAGSLTSGGAELLGSGRFREFLKQVSAVYDFVVLDSSPMLPVADTLDILPLVDGVIVCARERQTTRDEARAAKTALSRFPERPTGVVVTGIDPRQDGYDSYAYTYLRS